MRRWIPGKGYVDTVFEKGHTITEEEIRRSRGLRREALKMAKGLQDRGFERVRDMVPGLDSTMTSYAFKEWPSDFLTSQYTVYDPRGSYGKPRLDPEYWIKSPMEGIDPAAIIAVAAINYASRPMYRREWEMKLALEMTPEEIELELLLQDFGKDKE